MSDPISGGGLTLTARVAEARPRAGMPVVLVIELTNNGAGDVELPRWSPWFDHQFEITGPGGRELRRTAFGNEEYKRAGVQAQGAARVAPGGAAPVEVLVSRLFDMTLAGRYRVVLRRDVRDLASGEWATAVSEALEFVLED
jgi:hypothetical protein